MQHNPFEGEMHIAYSHYCTPNLHATTSAAPQITAGRTEEIHRLLREKIGENEYTCVAAQATFHQRNYRFGIYPRLASPEATAGLARDLFRFLQARDEWESDFTSFLAVFTEPRDLSEREFEALLWAQLQALHEEDRRFHGWSDEVPADPTSDEFAYSFAEHAFFVVGMHTNSSRLARRFPYPMLVFNLHEQFEHLRQQENFERMQRIIRERDRELQGSINPMLSDHGYLSAARQYSGRAVPDDWHCPFHPHPSRPDLPDQKQEGQPHQAHQERIHHVQQ